jgi:tetratricopeptide (TPR) repeat protein
MASSAATLAEALYELGRLEEAETWVDRAVALTVADMWTQLLWRQVRAKVLARRGEHADAERLAREAAALADEIDMIDAQGMAYADLAEVLSLGGKPDEAAAALEQALDRFDRKGNLVMAQRVRERLSEVEDLTAR